VNLSDLREATHRMMLMVLVIFVASLGLASLYELVVGLPPDFTSTVGIVCLVLVTAWIWRKA
jgi:hypothetical protein